MKKIIFGILILIAAACSAQYNVEATAFTFDKSNGYSDWEQAEARFKINFLESTISVDIPNYKIIIFYIKNVIEEDNTELSMICRSIQNEVFYGRLIKITNDQYQFLIDYDEENIHFLYSMSIEESMINHF